VSIDVSIVDGVAVLTMNRPERKNAFDRRQYEELGRRLDAIAADDAIRVAVLTGAGAAFSSGQDLKEMGELAERAARGEVANNDGTTGFTILLDALQRFPKPLVAAVNGVAVGIGMTLLPYCDIVLVAQSARLRVPFSELGVPPEAGSSVLFADVVGWQRAAELLLTSRWVSSDEAVEIGLALRSCPDASVLDEALVLAREIASKSPYSTRVIKELMVAGRGTRSTDARAREEALFATLFRSGGYGG
jgi:enoyl-CoA hydratase/carnithine racemase